MTVELLDLGVWVVVAQQERQVVLIRAHRVQPIVVAEVVLGPQRYLPDQAEATAAQA
jgi:hypothetical protein